MAMALMGHGPRAKAEARGRGRHNNNKKSNNNGYLNDRYQKTHELKEMLIKPGVSCYSDLPG